MAINFYDKDMVQITVGDRTVLDMTFGAVNENDRKWMADRLEEHFKQEINRAFNAGRRQAQAEMRHALGI